MIRIADILEHKGDQVLTVTADTPVARVAERMRLAQVGAFVVSRDGVHVEGLVTERDVVYALTVQGAAVVDAPVSAVMTHPVLTCEPHDPVDRVLDQLTRLRLRHLPVVERDRLCGLVSIGDLVRTYLDDDAYSVAR
jgi:CBS domain-containing protein